MLYILLIIIAIGVLLISEPGKQLLSFIVASGVILLVLGAIIIACLFGYFYIQKYSKNKEVSTTGSINNFTQKAETKEDSFPVNDSTCNQNDCSQYAWYDRHNVAMAYRCYSGNCTSEQWALAVYANSNDPRGSQLKKLADAQYVKEQAKFGSEKCVTEHDVKICDLKDSSTAITGNTDYRSVLVGGNSASCIDMSSGNFITNSSEQIRAKISSSFCASDAGYVYIDPTITVNKYWGGIKRGGDSSPYTINKAYDTCIWTWADGNGAIPYIDVFGNIGPRSGFNVKAFCKIRQNQVDIYTYE